MGACTVPVVTGRQPHEVLASNLHRLVFERQMTLDAVATSAGITLEHLNAICSGDIDPDLGLLQRIAHSVGVTASELIAEPNYN